MIELDVTIPSRDIVISGTLCLPAATGKFPTALFLQGSGPIDRNDNFVGQTLNNSKAIAHHLAMNDIATLRFDKRGIGQSTGDFISAGHTDFVDDALNSLAFLSRSEHCDSTKLFAIGHSEGAIIAPQVAQAFNRVAGVVLLCPTIEDPEALLLRQAAAIKEMTRQQSWFTHPLAKSLSAFSNPVRSQRKLIEKVKRSHHKIGKVGFSRQPFHWLRQFLALDLENVFSRTSCPVLAVSGAKDFQCLPGDAARIGEIIGGEYECHVLDDMTHLLRVDSGDGSVYSTPELLKQPIDPRVLTIVTRWIIEHARD
jgi:pimeloyl-ACP methyl ester carboxylesterase